jgi:hypothetical protein
MSYQENIAMLVKWCCGMFVGPARWHGASYYEPDECCGAGIIDVVEQDWLEGEVAVNCDTCGARLTQDMDHFEEVC